MKRHRRKGFTLLEVLVATTIMAIAVTTLLAALTTSLTNASRVADADRAAVLAKRTMDEIIAAPSLPGQNLQGQFDPNTGIQGGWQARVVPFEAPPPQQRGIAGIDRVTLEIWWMNGTQRRAFQIEGYRRTAPTLVQLGILQ